MTQQNFLSNESGAVTVDWVVLTAALVGLGLAVMGVISTGISSQSTAIDNSLEADNIIRTSFGSASSGTLSAADAEALAATSRSQQNVDLATSYAAAVTAADTADSTLAGLGYGTEAYADEAAFLAANSGTTSADYSNFNSSLSAASAANQSASIIANEGTQRGLTWNATNQAFE